MNFEERVPRGFHPPCPPRARRLCVEVFGQIGIAVTAVLLLAGCAASIRQYDLRDQPLSCDEANRFTYRTVEAMGYVVSAFQPAASGSPGRVAASRAEAGRDGEVTRITVTIDCGPGGATVDASRDGVLAQQLEVKRAFHHTFLEVRSTAAATAAIDRQVLAGTAPASQQRRDLKVVVTPLRGPASQLEFPFDLSLAGLLPVRVEVTNLTPRTYALDPAAARLATADRVRVAPLSPDEAAARIAAARAGDVPVTDLPAAALRDLLAGRQLGAIEIDPSARREGFLYFPLADYVAARVVLTDRASDEQEGVRVEFLPSPGPPRSSD